MQDMNHNGIPDNHEAKMAKADLYKIANYSMKLFKMIQEGDPMEGWVQAKITKAADYVASVYHFMEYELQTTEYGNHLENAEMYSESVRRAFEQKLNEAKACKEKLKEKATAEVDEGIEDRIEAAREKAKAKGKIKDDAKETPKSSVRKVAGKNYGGSKQKDDKEVDEGIEDRIEAAREKAKAKGKIKDGEQAEKKPAVRKVAGKAYGGSKQKDDKEVDEGFGYNKFGKKTDAYYATGGGKARRDVDRDDEGWAKTKKADDAWNKKVAAKGPVGK